MEIVLYWYLLPHDGRDVEDAGYRLLDALDVVHLKTHLNACLGTDCLLAGAARKDANHVRAELGEDRLEGASESGSIGQQKDDCSDAPCHTDDGDGCAASVML